MITNIVLLVLLTACFLAVSVLLAKTLLSGICLLLMPASMSTGRERSTHRSAQGATPLRDR